MRARTSRRAAGTGHQEPDDRPLSNAVRAWERRNRLHHCEIRMGQSSVLATERAEALVWRTEFRGSGGCADHRRSDQGTVGRGGTPVNNSSPKQVNPAGTESVSQCREPTPHDQLSGSSMVLRPIGPNAGQDHERWPVRGHKPTSRYQSGPDCGSRALQGQAEASRETGYENKAKVSATIP
jgi:hypothetical protein